MIWALLLAVPAVAALLALACNRRYTSAKRFYTVICPPGKIEGMHQEQFETATTPVIVVADWTERSGR